MVSLKLAEGAPSILLFLYYVLVASIPSSIICAYFFPWHLTLAACAFLLLPLHSRKRSFFQAISDLSGKWPLLWIPDLTFIRWLIPCCFVAAINLLNKSYLMLNKYCIVPQPQLNCRGPIKNSKHLSNSKNEIKANIYWKHLLCIIICSSYELYEMDTINIIPPL